MFVVFAISLLAGLLFTPLAMVLARKVGLYDKPSAKKLHTNPTPLLGGLAVLAAMFVGMWLVVPDASLLPPIILSMSLVALAGLFDDVRPTAPLWKLLALIPGAVAAMMLWPGEIPILLWPGFILGFLFVTNSVNLLDTIDGLTGLMTALSAAALGTMASFQGLADLSIAAFAMSGACVAFLFFNWRLIFPAAIFLGDMGALAIGGGLFIFAAYLVQYATTPADYVAVVLPIALVMVNSLLTVYIRKRKGLKALARTKDHISERLWRYGVPRWEVTLWLALVTLISCGAGVVAWLASLLVVEIVAIAIGILAIAYLSCYSLNLDLPAEGTASYHEKTICRIITRLDVGGPSQHCVYLANSLKQMGWQTYLLHGNIDPQAESSMEYLAEREGVDTYRIPTLHREVSPLADLQAFWHVYRMIRKFRPQIVHTHHAKAGTIGRIAAALCDVPIIIHTFHGISLSDYFGPIKSNIFLTIEKICAPVSSVLVTIGPNDRKELIALGVAPADKFVTIPLGLPLQRFADSDSHKGTLRKELGIAKDERLIVYIGRMVPIKNVSSFIDMAAAVVQKRDDVRFLLVGDGLLREELEQQVADLGITDSVTFYGVTDQMEKVYADADLVVLCSKREGMPVTMMEALAAARPVVSTQVGNVANSVIDGVTGRLVPPEDTSALTQAVLAALDDMEGSRRMAKAGQKHVLRSFGIETLTNRIDLLYMALISGSDYVDPVSVPTPAAVTQQTGE